MIDKNLIELFRMWNQADELNRKYKEGLQKDHNIVNQIQDELVLEPKDYINAV